MLDQNLEYKFKVEFYNQAKNILKSFINVGIVANEINSLVLFVVTETISSQVIRALIAHRNKRIGIISV